MHRIEAEIRKTFDACTKADHSRNIDDIMKAIATACVDIQMVMVYMNQQAEQNAKWAEEFDEYKVNLVKQQKEREQKEQEPHFVRGDELQ